MENKMTKGKNGELTPLGMKIILLYCVANVGMMVLDTVLDQYAVFFYAPRRTEGGAAAGAVMAFAPLVLAGLALNFGRFMDALANPIVGYLSDRTSTRWGRRIPYVLFGSIPMTIFFIMMFFPPLQSESKWNAVWFAFTCGGFLFLYTLVVAPYLALIPELAKSSDDRVKLSSWHAIASMLGLIIGSVATGVIVTKAGGGTNGIRTMAVSMGILSFATIIFTALTVKEGPVTKEKVAKISFMQALAPAFKNKHFLIYIFSISSFWLGYKVLQSSTIYVCTVILNKPEGYVSAIMAGMLVVLLLSIPLVFTLYNKFGKKKLFLAGLAMMMLFSPLQGLVMKAGAFMDATLFYHIIIALMGFPIALMLVIYNAVLSDIIDFDEKQTGFRREAMYYGIEGLFTKTTRGIGSSLSAVLFALFGLDAASGSAFSGITRSITEFFTSVGLGAGPATGLLLAGPICAVFSLAGVIIFSKYTLTK